MALDNAQFIAELSITDPPGTDPLSQGDDQIRTIKRATQQSFPNIDKAVTLTADQMNLAAIKNEANDFTALNTFHGENLVLTPDIASDNSPLVYLDEGAFKRWELGRVNTTTSGNFRLRRFDAGGLFQDVPWECNVTTGIVDFAQVPTVQGAPLWIAGELRMFVVGVSIGTNWFLANGANGTVNLADRTLMASGTSSAGTQLAPNLVATAAAGTTGSTAITVAQMPSHRHRIRSGGASGITDVALGNVSNQTVVGANRGNTSSAFFDVNSGGQQFIENSGLTTGHSHTSPAQAVTENGTSRDTVRPLSQVIAVYQYVP